MISELRHDAKRSLTGEGGASTLPTVPWQTRPRRLVVRTAGFHPAGRGSIPLGGATTLHWAGSSAG